jgi:L-malate glycosyltransferase
MVEGNRLSFATFFPRCDNIHLSKDVGMIPYIMHRDFGYDSYLICYKHGEFPYLETEVPGLKMQFLPHKSSFLDGYLRTSRMSVLSTLIDAFFFLKHNGKNFDIFQLYHLNVESILVGLIYRLINPRGILYLKLDMDPDIVDSYETNRSLSAIFSIRSILFKLVSFDIISAETKRLAKFLREKYPFLKKYRDKIHYIPNGVDVSRMAPMIGDFNEKENIILHVGRIGSYQKASEIILRAFSRLPLCLGQWRLLLIGPMEEGFAETFKAIVDADKRNAGNIVYLGFVDPKQRLYNYYNRAKILAMPSRYESFGLAAVEAGAFGDLILASDIPSFRELTNDGEFGCLCPIDDIDCFARSLMRFILNEKELREKAERTAEFIAHNYDWHDICSNLDKEITKIIPKMNNP